MIIHSFRRGGASEADSLRLWRLLITYGAQSSEKAKLAKVIVFAGKRKTSGVFRERKLNVEKSRVRSAEPAKRISSVVASFR